MSFLKLPAISTRARVALGVACIAWGGIGLYSSESTTEEKEQRKKLAAESLEAVEAVEVGKNAGAWETLKAAMPAMPRIVTVERDDVLAAGLSEKGRLEEMRKEREQEKLRKGRNGS